MPNSSRSFLPKAVRIAGLGLLVLGTLSASACVFSSSGPEKVDLNAWSYNRDLTAPGTITIRSLNGAIDVKPSTGNSLQVSAETRWHRGDPKRDLQFVAEASGNDVLICALWGRGICSKENYKAGGGNRVSFGSFFKKGTDANVHFTVLVPAGFKVNVATVNGGVNVTASAPVYARTINGSIKVGTAVNGQAYQATAGALTPTAGLGQGSASQGFPDGTNARRAQVGVRFIF